MRTYAKSLPLDFRTRKKKFNKFYLIKKKKKYDLKCQKTRNIEKYRKILLIL